MSDDTPTVFADLRTEVHDYGARGLLGMVLDPAFETRPYVYVLYTFDALIGGAAPRWGVPDTSGDPCPDPSAIGCSVSARLSRFEASGGQMVGVEQVLVEDWFQQFPDQSIGDLAFGPDGALYASAGDGASPTFMDSGQTANPNPDPPGEGGALRSQDLRTPADPVTLSGSVIRVDPDLGLPLPRIPSMAIGVPTVDSNRVTSYEVTSAFQEASLTTVRVLEPTNPAAGKPHRLLYVLPIEVGVWLGSPYGDGLEELRLLDVANRFNLTLIAPSFHLDPWYGDHDTDPDARLESFIVNDLVPFGDTFAQSGEVPRRWLIGFSKSGNGALSLILRHPHVFSAAAVWDAPVQITDTSAFSGMVENFGTESNFDRYEIPSLVVSSAEAFQQHIRIWISGDDADWTTDMMQLDQQMVQAGVRHTFVAGGRRVHSWFGGWLDGAVASLDANDSASNPVDPNAQRVVAYGLRHPASLAFRPGTEEIWIADIGPGTVDEINRIAGPSDGSLDNFGWPCRVGNDPSFYDSAGLSICEDLSTQPSAVESPFHAYAAGQPLFQGDSCYSNGGSSITGVAFMGPAAYPPIYDGALLLADRLRRCVWALPVGANGQPDPGAAVTVLADAASPVDLKPGPRGDIFYVDQDGGTVRRIRYSAGNQSPVAVIQTSSPTTGTIPLIVAFSAVDSVDPEGDALSYTWDLDGDGAFDDSTSLNPNYTYTDSGSRTVLLRVQDESGLSDVAAITIVADETGPVDTMPPVVSNVEPAGVLPWGTVQATLSVTTNEAATCRYGPTAGTAYGALPTAFAATGGTSHTSPLTGLADGGSYTHYVRCEDGAGNANPADVVIAFTVAVASSVPTSTFAGAESPLSELGAWDSPGDWADLAKNDGAYAQGVNAQARLVTPLVGADQYAEITYDQDPGGSSWVGVATRIQGADDGSCYLAIAYAGQVRLYRTDDAGGLSFTLLASTSAALATAPRRLRLESEGTTHRVYFNGVEVINHIAGGPLLYTGGQPGLAAAQFGGPQVKMTFFEGGTLE